MLTEHCDWLATFQKCILPLKTKMLIKKSAEDDVCITITKV